MSGEPAQGRKTQDDAMRIAGWCFAAIAVVVILSAVIQIARALFPAGS